MVNKKTWKEFQESGLFWWINMILHTFGWAIVIEQDKETKETICAIPQEYPSVVLIIHQTAKDILT